MNTASLQADSDPAQERWLPVVGHEDMYEISDMGRVRSLPRVVQHGLTGTRRQTGGLLSPVIDSAGYPTVALGRLPQRRVRVHTLVLEAFVGPRPPRMVCRHLDDVKRNNRLSNLCWGTQSENVADGYVNGRRGRRAA